MEEKNKNTRIQYQLLKILATDLAKAQGETVSDVLENAVNRCDKPYMNRYKYRAQLQKLGLIDS